LDTDGESEEEEEEAEEDASSDDDDDDTIDGDYEEGEEVDGEVELDVARVSSPAGGNDRSVIHAQLEFSSFFFSFYVS
jgi:hypothetical protein